MEVEEGKGWVLGVSQCRVAGLCPRWVWSMGSQQSHGPRLLQSLEAGLAVVKRGCSLQQEGKVEETEQEERRH